jgi:hypothetical protein
MDTKEARDLEERKLVCFRGYVRLSSSVKFEAQNSIQLAAHLGGFVRGAEGSPIDAAITDEETVIDLTEKIYGILEGTMDPTTTDNADPVTTEPFTTDVEKGLARLLLIEYKTGHRWWAQRVDGRHIWIWVVHLSRKQMEHCVALILGFPAHPDWCALVPLHKLKIRKVDDKDGPVYVAIWRAIVRRRLVNTVPPEVWSYMVRRSDLERALLTMKEYMFGRQDEWYEVSIVKCHSN